MTSPARFCLVTTFYPPYSFGGDAVAVQRMARALARRGHDVTVVHDADAYTVLSGAPAPEPPPPDPGGVRVVTLRTRLPMVSTLLTLQSGRPLVNGRRLRRLLDDGRFDVIVFNNVSLVGGPGVLARGAGAATLYFAHEHWLVCPTHALWRYGRERCDGRDCLRCQLSYLRPPQWWRYTSLLADRASQVDAFVALSEFSRAKHREFGFPYDMEVLPNFLPDPDPLPDDIGPPPHDRPYFLYAGRLESLKGVDDVVRASDDYPSADVLIAGHGAQEPALRRLAAGNPRVRFVGQVPADLLGAYYRHAIASLAPSQAFETFGLTLIESFSHATPVIARRVGPFPELVEPSGGGLLFETRADLLEAMRHLQASPEHRARMSAAAFAACRTRWSESVVMPQFDALVDRARARRRARTAG